MKEQIEDLKEALRISRKESKSLSKERKSVIVLRTAAEQLLAKIESEREKKFMCQDCGQIKPSVHEDICPYSQEINGTVVPIVICDECYTERTYDI